MRSDKLTLSEPEGRDLTDDNLLGFLRDNPALLQQLNKLQLPSIDDINNYHQSRQPQSEKLVKSERQVLPPVIPPGPGTPGRCSLVTGNGIPCDPGSLENNKTALKASANVVVRSRLQSSDRKL